jgi:Rod binding domain-containing protein
MLASAYAPPTPPVPAVISQASSQAVAGQPVATVKAATPEQRAKISKTAQAFEASVISTLVGQMFRGVDADAPFSGGAGEQAFRSFMTDAIGKSMAQKGGLGLAKSVTAEMLKMQGLT